MDELMAYYAWDLAFSLPVLVVTVMPCHCEGGLKLPEVIDRVYAYVEQQTYPAVCIAYDLRSTDGRLPLNALMQSAAPSPKVQRVAVIGARARTDEMAVLIAAAAKQVTFPIRFFPSYAQAVPFLVGREAAPSPQERRTFRPPGTS